MRILVISANRKLFPDPVYPLGAAGVATIARDSGHEVDTFDCNFAPDLEGDLSLKLRQFQPQVIAISMRNVDNTTLTRPQSFLPDYQEIIGICRKHSAAKIILGGSGFSLFPKAFFERLQPDYGVIGNAEQSLADLLSGIEQDHSLNHLIYAHQNGAAEKSLMVDRSFFDLHKYYELGGLISIQTQRGCAFKCAYCTYPFLEGYRLVSRAASAVVDEFEYLQESFATKYFFIVDSVFNHSEKHVLDICNELVRRNVRIKWSAYLRPKYNDAAIFPAMKEAGCRSIELGTDALAEPTLQSFAKSFTVDDVLQFCGQCRKVGIAFCHSLIFGAPGETAQTVETTVRNIQASRPTAVLAFLGTRILPNTPLAEHCLRSGYVKKAADIGIEPLFYVQPGLDQDWLLNYLRHVARVDKRWIIPGVTTPRVFTQKLMRLLNRRGLLWEFKKYATFGQRVREKLLRN